MRKVNQQGFIMIEISIVIILVSVALIALTGVLLVVVKTAKQAEFQSHLPYYAQQKLEGLKAGIETDTGTDTNLVRGVEVKRIWNKELYQQTNGQALYKLSVILTWWNGKKENQLRYDTYYKQEYR